MHKSVEEIEGDIFGDHQKYKLEKEGRRIREIFQLETELNSFVNPEVQEQEGERAENIVWDLNDQTLLDFSYPFLLILLPGPRGCTDLVFFKERMFDVIDEEHDSLVNAPP